MSSLANLMRTSVLLLLDTSSIKANLYSVLFTDLLPTTNAATWFEDRGMIQTGCN